MSAFDPKSLLGEAESDRLEFKQKEALARPANIGREVVGFLNAKGGEILIGVEEKDGIAVGLQPIADVERARSALLDHLIDAIQPQFRPEEVKLDCEGGLIHVTVKKGSSPLYAQRDGGWRFWIRIDSRLRELSFHEIAEEFIRRFRAESTKKDRVVEIAAELRKDQARVAIEKPQLWLRLVPTESLEIDFDKESTQEQFRTWLMDPSATGNRRSGWTFAHDLRLPDFRVDRVEHGDIKDYMRTLITKQGRLTFTLGSDNLRQPVSAGLNFAPYALVEYPVSVFRLMAAILKGHAHVHANLHVVAGLVISGIRGWSLRPGSPREPARLLGRPKVFEDNELVIDPENLKFDAGEIRENPDRCGLRLVRLIYEKFDFKPDAIPPEFDRTQGRLLLE